MSGPDFSDACMVALYPPPDLAAELAVPDGLDPDELHVTVAYVGDVDQIDRDALRAVAEALSTRPTIAARISGHARFTGDDSDVLVALVDSPDLEDLRRQALDQLAAAGIEVHRDHGYIPHITLAYLDPGDRPPVDRIPAAPVAFGSVSAVWGVERTDYALVAEAGIAPYARAAYAQGWAATAGPMTDRVRAGCIAAVEYAAAHADDPDVLEVTLRLGHLEGTWAAVYDRREEQLTRIKAAVYDRWATLVDQLDPADTVRRLRRTAGLTEADDPDGVDYTAAAVQAAAMLLATMTGSDDWRPLRDLVADALRQAAAEGQAAALAVAADAAGMVGFSFDLAFEDAYAEMELLGDWAGDASAWLARILDGAGTDLGRALADLMRTGGSYRDMVRAVTTTLGTKDVRAIETLLDLAHSQAMSRGTVSLYQRTGVLQVDYVTAGDQRVCPTCETAELGNPYPLHAAPVPGLHPLCRCCLTATSDYVDVLTLTAAQYAPEEVT